MKFKDTQFRHFKICLQKCELLIALVPIYKKKKLIFLLVSFWQLQLIQADYITIVTKSSINDKSMIFLWLFASPWKPGFTNARLIAEQKRPFCCQEIKEAVVCIDSEIKMERKKKMKFIVFTEYDMQGALSIIGFSKFLQTKF